MIINTNISALNTLRQSTNSLNSLQKSSNKLSSGKRINTSSDDAAGLAISEKMKSQIRGLNRATMNAEDAVSLIKTSDGAINELQSILQRVRELSVQAANGTNTDDDRYDIQAEVKSLIKEYDSISKTTAFNGINTIDGSLRDIEFTDANITGSRDLSSGVTLTESSAPTLNNSINTPIVIKEGNSISYSIKYTYRSEVEYTKFDSQNGFYSSPTKWVEDEIKINIPGPLSCSGKELEKKINDQINEHFKSKGQDNCLEVKYESWTIGSTSSEKMIYKNKYEGSQATLTVGSRKVTGTDKNNYFAVEINAQFTEKDFDIDELSQEEKDILLQNNILYRPTGYIIPDPNNPYDYIEYKKTPGTGQTVEVNLEAREYLNVEDFTQELQDKLNLDRLGDKVIVNINSNGNLEINTQDSNGSKSSIQFIKPSYPYPKPYEGEMKNPLDYLRYKANTAELLSNFTNSIGVDKNVTIGKDGSNPLNIQVGPNYGNSLLISVDSVRAGAVGIKNLDILTQENASEAISIIDNALSIVSKNRSSLGAVQNRLEHIISNNENSSLNLTAAESRISDADMAKEMAEYTKNKILNEASQAMLYTAKQAPQQILDLLK